MKFQLSMFLNYSTLTILERKILFDETECNTKS